MLKAVVTRTKDKVVEVNGTRIGTAQRSPGSLGSSPWWTLWIDEEYRFKPDQTFESHATGDRVREAAVIAYQRSHDKRVIAFAEANIPGFARQR